MSYTIADAARAIGVHPHTVRKRIKAGRLRAALLDGPNGREYRIPVDVVHRLAAEATVDGVHPQRRPSHTPSAAGLHPDSRGESSDSGSGLDPAAPSVSAAVPPDSRSATALAIARAQEMAAYTQRLLEPLQTVLAHQAEEIGRLKAELAHERARLTELTAATVSPAPEPEPPARRPWWRFW